MWHLTSFGFFQKCQFPLFFTPSPQVVASSLPRPTSYCSGLTGVGNPARGCQRSQRSFHNIIFGEGSYSFSPVGAFSELCEHIREISLTGLSPSHHCCWTLNSPRTRHISRELGCTGTYVKVKCLIFIITYLLITLYSICSSQRKARPGVQYVQFFSSPWTETRSKWQEWL